jgi:phosphate transport system protein
MTRLIDKGLAQLTSLLIKMGELAEKTVDLSFCGYLQGTDVREKVRIWSETLSVLNLEVDEKARDLLARFQPVASDLRVITSYMKIAYDLLRYGRYAWDIALIYHRLNVTWEDCAVPWLPLEKMADKALETIHLSIETVKTNDVEFAKQVGELEHEIDVLYYDGIENLREQAPDNPQCAIANLLFILYLERLSDHAAYIGESIIYSVTSEYISLR